MSMAFPVEAVRRLFPALSLSDNGRRRIYLDNPAGTQVPRAVGDAVHSAILSRNANLGGNFVTSRQAGEILADAHRDMAEFVGAGSPDEIIIGPNMTSLTYQLSRTLARDWGAGDEIVLTQMDHEGNVGPWMQAAQDRGATVRWLPFSQDTWQLEPDALKPLLGKRTRLVALNYASNLTGSINRIGELVRLAKNAGALTYVDAVQMAPHGLIDVAGLDCDFLACSAYKFFGPHLGIVFGRKAVLDSLVPYKLRCSSNEYPTRFETGTPQIELLAGLSAAVDHFAAIGRLAGGTGTRRQMIAVAYAASVRHEAQLARQLIEGIREVPGLRILGIAEAERMSQRVPTVSFVVDGIAPASLVDLVNGEGIFCWAGHNYAWGIVHQLGIAPERGVARIGIANYNTGEEIAETIESVTRNLAMLRQQR